MFDGRATIPIKNILAGCILDGGLFFISNGGQIGDKRSSSPPTGS